MLNEAAHMQVARWLDTRTSDLENQFIGIDGVDAQRMHRPTLDTSDPRNRRKFTFRGSTSISNDHIDQAAAPDVDDTPVMQFLGIGERAGT